MNGSSLGRILIIIAFFTLLSFSAGTSFPEDYFDDPLPRGVLVLHTIVSAAGTQPFGEMGGSFFFGFLGIIFVGLVYRQTHGANKQRKPEPSTDIFARSERTQARLASISRKQITSLSPKPVPAKQSYDLNKMLAILTQKRETSPVPAWALLLRSPYKSWADATSWLGGRPKAPADFTWPREANGKPQVFLAQIDLGSLKVDPETAERHFNLPASGALLVFFGTTQTVQILTVFEMASAQTILPPDDLPPLNEWGFSSEGNAFIYWPVDLEAYTSTSADYDGKEMSTSEFRPPIFPNRFSDPQNWILNWALAVLDAEVVIASVENEIRQAEWSRQYRNDMAKLKKSEPPSAYIERQNNHYDMVLNACPSVLVQLHQWRDYARSQDPQAPVDRAMLEEIFDHRHALKNRMAANYGSIHALAGSADEVWQKLRVWQSKASAAESLRNLPPEYQDFVEAKVTDWRSHRLFGIEPPFTNNGEDLRGWSCLISVFADGLLGTQTENDYGMSVWFKRKDLQKSNFTNGQFVRHCAI